MNDEQKPLEQMTLAEMEARRDVVEEEIAALKAKLDKARAERITTGKWADPDWYRRATARLRFTGIEHQKLTRRIAQVKREQRRAQVVSVEQAFVGVAREILARGDFDAIMDSARARASLAST